MPSSPRSPACYRPRDPRGSPFYRLVQDHLEDFALTLRQHETRKPLPDPGIVDTFRDFLECGILRFGAVRYRCPDCGQNLFVGFSCRRRGLCYSCDAKRSAYTAAHAMDFLLPPVPYRQWVLSVPKRLRWHMNDRPDLVGEVSSILAQVLDEHLRQRHPDGQSAQLHFVQRFGAALNLHLHLHVVAADGVFEEVRDRRGSKSARFTKVPAPTQAELKRLLEIVRRKVLRRFVRLGVIPQEVADQMLSWGNSGFSLHADTWVRADDREGLRRLLRYCSRPGFSPKRLRYLPGQNLAIYDAERQEGTCRQLRLDPVELLRRIALLKPPKRKNLVRYHGALAPNAPMRPLIAEAARRYARKTAPPTKIGGAVSRSWASLIARVFEVDPLLCPRCGTRMEPVAVIMEVPEVTRLMDHLGLDVGFPKTLPARSPPKAEEGTESPDEDSQLDPRGDL